MHRGRLQVGVILASGVVFLTGCQVLPELGCGAVGGSEQASTVSRVAPESSSSEVASGIVRVHLVNGSGSEADVRVTMRVAGHRVRFSTRRIAAGAEDVIIGPDRADSVMVEATLRTEPPQVLPIRNFFLGKDFQSGDTLVVVLEPPVEEPAERPLPPPEPEPGPPSPELRIRIVDPSGKPVFSPNSPILINIAIEGASPAGLVRVFADVDENPDSGDELAIAAQLPAAPALSVPWTVPAISGVYRLYAEVQDQERLARSDPALIRVNSPPMLAFDSPPDGLAVTHGFEFIIAWAGQDADDNARITIFLDTNDEYGGDGTEYILRDDIFSDDIDDREYVVDTTELAPGDYYVGGIISDGYRSIVVYAGRVCIVDRLVGRFSADDLEAGWITTISGGADNRAFGTAVDIGRSSNLGIGQPRGDDDLPELMIADPLAMAPAVDCEELAQLGVVYLHWNDGYWPRHLSVSDITTWIVGEQEGADTGRRVALIENVGCGIDCAPADTEVGRSFARGVLIGAHRYVMEQDEGRAYHLTADPELGEVRLDEGAGIRLFGSTGDYAGLDVAALGDLDGDGAAEFAVGAVQVGDLASGPGRVYVISGATGMDDGYLESIAGITLVGAHAGDQAGYAIRGLPDIGDNAAGLDEIVIGAPGAVDPDDETRRPGVVYVVFGETWMLQQGAFHRLDMLGVPGKQQNLDGLIFVGQNDGDLVGAALAVGDFDGDGRPDLLIGAPGFDGGRGRVYLVYNVGNVALPRAPAAIDLGLIGAEYPGAVFDGVAPGDQLGLSLAAADFDGDGADDLVLGAPAAESQRGSMFLIYGGQEALAGPVPLAPLPTCGLHGVQLVGAKARIDRLGESLSGGGDLNGDGIDDLAIGAPGDADTPGAVHLLFGWPGR